MCHYHVNTGSGGGYMPYGDASNVVTLATLTEAREYARDIMARMLDDDAQLPDDYSPRTYDDSDPDFIIVSDPNKLYDLGEYIQVVPCNESECESDD